MKIAVLVSGGVDSSVALRLLQDQGHEVVAFYLKIWLEDELAHLGECPWEEDLAYVRAVCEQASVPLRVLSLQQEYWDHVVTYAIAEIKAGRTPNPDIHCNKQVKFGFFIEHLKQSDEHFDKVATGHYAQLCSEDGMYYLRCAPDPVKDQTYFLAYLTQEQLALSLFPIGHLMKSQVRELAQEYDLPNKDRKDSQGICFLGKLKFSEFIKHHLGERTGDLVEIETGKKVGEHKGFWYYTIGQRQGLGLAGGPWYIVSKDLPSNTVYISRTYYADDKKRDAFAVVDCVWFAGNPPVNFDQIRIKMRHGKQFHACTIQYAENKLYVKLVERDQGIAPGQFAVLYQGDMCLGAGVIAINPIE